MLPASVPIHRASGRCTKVPLPASKDRLGSRSGQHVVEARSGLPLRWHLGVGWLIGVQRHSDHSSLQFARAFEAPGSRLTSSEKLVLLRWANEAEVRN